MVGVPGRSNACHTCRQRHIKCGGEKPKCANCIKSGRMCAGYQVRRAFVLSKDMAASRLGTSEIVSISGDDPDSAPVFISRWRLVDRGAPASRSSSTSSGPSQAAQARRPIERGPEPASGLPSPLDYRTTARHANRDQLLGFFLRMHLPNEELEFPHRDSIKNRNFLLHLPDLPDISPTLETALLAVCSARLGTADGHSDLAAQSLTLYTQALQEVRVAVLDPATRHHEQTLAACMSLTLYEMWECPGKGIRGYLAHIEGALELLQSRGADAHESGIAHAVFCSLRLHAGFLGLQRNTRTFLSYPEWHSHPFTKTSRDNYDDVISVLLELPDLGALAFMSDYEPNPSVKLCQLLTTVDIAWRADRELSILFQRIESSTSGPLYRPELSTLNCAVDNEKEGKPFPVRFQFTAFVVGQTMMVYWVAQMLLHSYMCKAYHELAELVATVRGEDGKSTKVRCSCEKVDTRTNKQPKSNQGMETRPSPPSAAGAQNADRQNLPCLLHFRLDKLPPLEHRSEPENIARKICQAAEYFLQDSVGGYGRALLMPVLVCVRRVFLAFGADWTREALWADEVLRLIKLKGNSLATFL
ncbi:hypothetical protein GQ53DRAFT_726641 [Thozetella sp. PMI_491]|nr:hypothetical protein GQ53DRAFT_726641 [Thozetella sp. PMI_491]